jgi:hypothetical protein
MKSTAHNFGAGCLILFALPFVVMGTGAAVAFMRGLARGGEMRVVLGIVGMVFAAIGVALIAAALTGRKRALRIDELRAQHPGQPWMWNEEWASRRIGDSNRTNTAVLWVFALLWNAVSWPVLVVLPKELTNENYVVLVALIFPVAGLILIGGAIRATMRVMRFQRSALVLDHVPVPLGGSLRGRVEVPYEPLAEAAIVVRLTAVNRVRSGKSTHESIVFQEEIEIARGAVSRMPDRVSIPIEIDVPHDLPATQTEGRSQSLWRLTVDAELPGIDYNASFDVPVFRTELTTQSSPAKARLAPPEPREPADFVSKHTARGRELYFGRFRARGLAMGMLFITLCWTVVLAVLAVTGTPRFLLVIFGLLDLLMIWSTLDLFLANSTIVLDGDNVIVRRSRFLTSEKVIRRNEIASAVAKIGARSGGRPYYEIEVRTAAGKKVSAASHIRSKREAEWVASQIHGAADSTRARG